MSDSTIEGSKIVVLDDKEKPTTCTNPSVNALFVNSLQTSYIDKTSLERVRAQWRSRALGKSLGHCFTFQLFF